MKKRVIRKIDNKIRLENRQSDGNMFMKVLLASLLLIVVLSIFFLVKRYSPRERTFDNCYEVREREKIPYKITIRKNLDKFTVIFNSDKVNGGEAFDFYSGKNLKLYKQSFIEQGDYSYWGVYLDNSGEVGSMKIRTYRPLEDFIVNGVSSEEKNNVIWHSNAHMVRLIGSTEFIVGDKPHGNTSNQEQDNSINNTEQTTTTDVTSEEKGFYDENTGKTYLERLKKAEEFWSVLPWNEVNNSLNAYKYRDIIAERYHIWFNVSDTDSDAFFLTNPKDIIEKYYLAGRSMDNFRFLKKLDFDKWANNNGVQITALDPRTTISPRWYKRHGYEECVGILKYGVESEDADEIGQILKRRIEDNVYYSEEIIEAVERFQNQGYLSKVTNREIKEFFEKELRKY
jgi:hypothetical protein